MVWAGHKKQTEFEGEALIIWAECGGPEAHISGYEMPVRHSQDTGRCFAPNPVMGVVTGYWLAAYCRLCHQKDFKSNMF